MGNTSEGFRRERVWLKRVKFWRLLGLITLNLVVVAKAVAKVIEILLEIINKFRP